jgi:F-type H+-transporting ATPase subunit b
MWTRSISALMVVLILAAAFLAVCPTSVYASSAGGSHEGNVPRNPLDWQKDLALWSFIIFLVLFAVLYKAAWGPICDGLSKREKGIADQIAEAAEANRQAKELLAGYEAKLAESALEVRAILDKARNDAEATAREREAKAEADAKARFERAEKEIAAATAAAAKDLADRSAKLAVDLAGKIVHAKLNPKDHAQLIEQAVGSFTVNQERGKFASRN